MLGALAVWGWRLGEATWSKLALGALFPAVAALLWGVFAVPNDPSRNPKATVVVPGVVRLLLEWALFGLAAYGLWSTGSRAAAETLLTVTALHYALSWERIAWLVRHGGKAISENRAAGGARCPPGLPWRSHTG